GRAASWRRGRGRRHPRGSPQGDGQVASPFATSAPAPAPASPSSPHTAPHLNRLQVPARERPPVAQRQIPAAPLPQPESHLRQHTLFRGGNVMVIEVRAEDSRYVPCVEGQELQRAEYFQAAVPVVTGVHAELDGEPIGIALPLGAV